MGVTRILYLIFAAGFACGIEHFKSINPSIPLPKVQLRQESFVPRRYRRQVTVSQAFKDQAITDHNTARNGVSPAATNMHIAVWNEDLALTAQNYANLCIWAHNPNMTADTVNKVWYDAGSDQVHVSYVGENLYRNSDNSLSDIGHLRHAIELWDAEKADYNYNANNCSSTDPGCGHYTQVVWHNSAHVGCGINYCSNFPGTIVVCNYGPSGNFGGQKPYSTDNSVTPCTQNPCVQGGTCTVSGSSYTCSCTSAYTGTNCQTATICASTPCQNGGSCVANAAGTSFTCTCASGFTGSTCATAVPCSSNPCLNGATCTENGATYTCSCQSGYTGSNCETELTSDEFTCGFESSDMCGFSWTGSNFPWQRRSGTTPSNYTGPSSANEGSYYVYTEVSGSWSSSADAVLTSSAIFAAGTRCVTFDYHMYGTSVGTLEVLAGNTVIWTLSGSQGNQWHTQEVETTALGNNKYIYVTGGSVSVGDEAYIETDNAFSASAGSVCIQFLFSMLDGVIQVGARPTSGSDNTHNLTYNTNNYWYGYSLTASSSWINTRKLFFKAIIGSSSSDFAIDDIDVTQGACSSSKRQLISNKRGEGEAHPTHKKKGPDFTLGIGEKQRQLLTNKRGEGQVQPTDMKKGPDFTSGIAEKRRLRERMYERKRLVSLLKKLRHEG
ncbi:hypothetical protein FSP39_024639 [Pinctada imbricata]|uniref:Uncharacterized protein n=1 Tax=Pinctada imbricata TaxID=66713 RepID=A0AA88XYE1_PINIB|nr:hypothetical protein FSP39_024639 [Pinctada imbricata]